MSSIDLNKCQNLAELFFRQAAAHKRLPFLHVKKDKAWQGLTWGQVADKVEKLAKALSHFGIEAGDRVVLVGHNQPDWLIADFAIMSLGAWTVPAYTTNTQADHAHILELTQAKAVIFASRQDATLLLPAAENCVSVKFGLSLSDEKNYQALPMTIYDWSDVDRVQTNMATFNLLAQVAKIQRTDTACIISTSGTGGKPRGVVLTHGALLSNCEGAYDLLKSFGLERSRERFLSFLPVSHAYERTAGQFFPVAIAAEIYYAESVEALIPNMAETQPTIMVAVPRLYEMIYRRINNEMKKKSPRIQSLFALTQKLGRKQYKGELGLLERGINFFLTLAVRRSILKKFGGNLKAVISGGAPLSPEIGYFLNALHIPILQGYGQTETAPIVSCNPPKKAKLETVGPPFKGVEVRIAEDGEILVRGELNMSGYWRDPEATAEALKDGWVHTGDIGELDADGYLRITDRKKDIIVVSGGDTLSPQRVEGQLTLQPEIAQAMVYGDQRPYLVAVIVPNPEWLAEMVQAKGLQDLDQAALWTHPDIHAGIKSAVKQVNDQLSSLERVRNFIIAEEAFTPDNKMMTVTLKLRRHVISEHYGTQLDHMYGAK